jgi:DNA-binding NarL/FixJ family response regulator
LRRSDERQRSYNAREKTETTRDCDEYQHAGKNGFDAAQFILASSDYRPAIVILSNHMDELLVRESKRIGAQGFVTKSEAYSRLVVVAGVSKIQTRNNSANAFSGASL